MPRLILTRHGQASFGSADYDLLSATGVEQAALVAADLAAQGVRVDRVVSGSLGRQRGTADPIAEAMGCEVEVDPRWDEYDADDILEHHSSSNVRQDRPPGSDAEPVTPRAFQEALEAALLAWLGAGRDGPAREPWPRFSTRVTSALDELGGALDAGQTAVVCTSGGVLAALCVALLAVPEATFVAFNRVTVNAGITRVAYGRAGPTLLSFNEQSHLLVPGRDVLTYR